MLRDEDSLALLRRWHAGDTGAMHALLEQHLPALHEFVGVLLDRDFPGLRRDQDSMDLVQSAAVKALGYLPRFLPRDEQQFQSLLRTFVRNELRNQVRSPRWTNRSRGEHRDSLLDLEGRAPSSDRPDRATEKAEERAWVRLALEFLDDDEDRLLLQLHAIEQAPWDSVARALGMESADAARMRYVRRVQPRLANILRLLKNGEVDVLLAETRME